MLALASSIWRVAGLTLLCVMLAAGLARADYQAGLDAYGSGDYAMALKEWQAAAAKGEARAQHGLGLLYDYGRGVPADPAQAAKWYGLAAAQNLPDSQNNLAFLYAEGRGVPKDMVKADQLWMQAAKAGHPSAQFNIGLSYYRGEGVPKSYPDAAGWFASAAAGGEVRAQYAIGEMYRMGRGVRKDMAMARRWLTEAAKNGSAPAAERLAQLPPDTSGGTAAAQAPAPQPTIMTQTSLPPAADTAMVGTTSTASTVPATAPTTTVAMAPILPATSTPPATPPAATQTAVPAAGSGMLVVTPSLTHASSAATATTTQTSDGSGSTTVLTASDANGSLSGGEAPAPSAPLTPLSSSSVIAATTPPATPPATTGPVAQSTGVINLGLPLAGTSDSAGTSVPSATLTVAALPAGTEGVTGGEVFRIWIGTFKNESDARSYWSQEVQRFPDLLKKVELVVRQIDLGASQGVWFRVMGGPFATREAADKLCGAIKTRSPVDDCRVVLN